MISKNVKHYFWVWIFREHEFTDPLLKVKIPSTWVFWSHLHSFERNSCHFCLLIQEFGLPSLMLVSRGKSVVTIFWSDKSPGWSWLGGSTFSSTSSKPRFAVVAISLPSEASTLKDGCLLKKNRICFISRFRVANFDNAVTCLTYLVTLTYTS